jgi:uncharacterized protein (DUF58 family)
MDAEEKQAWVRFLLATAGLAIAFAAAVFSNVAARQGNSLAAAALASAALLTAGLVGLFTVPYLARRVQFAHWVEAFDYDVTREGVLYLALALVIAVAALNTGNNLLFIVVSAMLAAIVVSGIVSSAILRGLGLNVALPERVFARTTVAGRIVIANQRRFLPAFSVSVVTPDQRGRRELHFLGARTPFPFGRVPGRHWFMVPDMRFTHRRRLATAPPIFDGAAYFAYVPARANASADVELNFPKRGLYSQETFGLRTRFPFSFLVKTRRVRLARELIVYPSVEATDEALEVLPMITGEFASSVRGRGFDLYRIREYVPEDSARHVDWKATARSGSLKIREFTREDERRLRIVFDNPVAGMLSSDEYERTVELTASLAWHFSGEGAQLSYLAPGFEGGPDVYDFLRYLALVQPNPSDPGQLALPTDPDAFQLIVTARPRGSIPTSLWANAYVIFAKPNP